MSLASVFAPPPLNTSNLATKNELNAKADEADLTTVQTELSTVQTELESLDDTPDLTLIFNNGLI